MSAPKYYDEETRKSLLKELDIAASRAPRWVVEKLEKWFQQDAEGKETVDGEPAIVSWGRQLVDKYPVQEYRDALVRAFRKRKADFIVLDDNPRGQEFLTASTAWAVDEGLIFHDRSEDDGQQVVSSFRLTEKGRKEILGE